MEVDSTDWGIKSTERPQRFHLVTLELETGRKTHHHIEDIPDAAFPEQLEPWRAIIGGFHEPAWLNGQLFVPVLGSPSSSWILFDPAVLAARRVRPMAEGTCLDCPRASEWRHLLESYGKASYSGAMHAAQTNGKLSNVLYFEERAARGVAAIDKIGPDHVSERLLVLERRFKRTSVRDIRVSPNERYLAYTLTTNLRSAIPLPTLRHEIHVFDLRTEIDHRVPSSFWLSGNLMWSADSQRLYYTVVDVRVADGHRDGVYSIRFPSEE